MPQPPPQKSAASLALWLWVALGALPGVAGGAWVGRAFFTNNAADAEETGGSTEAGGTYAPLAGGAEGDSANGRRGGSRSKLGDAKPIHGGLFKNLQSAAANLSQAQRLEELQRMLEFDTRPERRYTAGQNPQGGVDRSLQYMALIQKEDLPHLQSMLDSMSPGRRDGAWSMRTACANAWAMLDPAGLESWVFSKIDDGESQRFNVETNGIAGYWSTLDPNAAWAKAMELDGRLSNTNDNTGWLNRIMNRQVAENGQLAYQRAEALKNRSLRRSAIATCLSDLAKTDFDKAIQMADTRDNPREAVSLQSSVISSNARNSGKYQEMMEYVIRQQNDQLTNEAMGNLLHGWSQKDKDGMIAWFDAAKKNPSMTKLVEQWGGSGYFTRNTPNPEQAIEEALAMEAGEKRQGKLSEAYSSLMNQRPEEALKRLKALDEDTLKQVAPNMLSTLTQYDPERAAQLARTLPEEAQKNAVGNIVSQWMSYDSVAASTWLDSLPSGAVKDSGIQNLIGRLSYMDPEAAASWALAISTEDGQRQSLQNAMSYWGRNDPAGALSWLKTQTIPEKTREALTQQLESRLNRSNGIQGGTIIY
jgi:hypothetical protein